MHVFNKENTSWSDKLNFVDDNNVIVGYDYSQSCCESFGYGFSDCLLPEEVDLTGRDLADEDEINLEGYNFDTTFYEHGSGMEDQYYAVFKLVKPGEKDLYLYLWNHHNGYYAHGFEMKVGEKELYCGSL